MSHFQPYSAYKDSGVEWLGQIPKHWNIIPLKWLFECLDGMRIPLNSEERSDIKGNIPYWGSGGIVDYIERHIFDEPLILLGEDGAPFFERDRPVAYAVEGESWINNHIHVLKPLNRYPLKWFVHVLNSVEYRLYINGSTRDKLTQDNMKNIAVSMPASVEEASSIVASLELETARIDGLVSKKTRFIELLREKRQALITHAVTKGLDPNVKMKDSGVEWLGQVPVHWGILPIKHIVATPITDGPHETPDFVDKGIPFVSAEAISSGRINFEKIRGYITEEAHRQYSEKYHPQRGDIFMIKSGATTGITAIVETDIDFNIWSPLAVIRCGARSDPHFVLSYMRSRNFQDAIELNWNYGTQQNIGMGVIGDLAITVPPFEEQIEIASRIDSQTTRLDTLINKTERSIELLKERRSALITAAVTGQIDLREAA